MKTNTMKMHFRNETLYVTQTHYASPPFLTALNVHDEYEHPYTTATRNFNIVQPVDYVLIKNYSENEGILQAMIEAGIVETPRQAFTSGFVKLHQCRLTDEACLTFGITRPAEDPA